MLMGKKKLQYFLMKFTIFLFIFYLNKNDDSQLS